MTDLIVLPLSAASASLEVVGGKGRLLASLAGAALPVPTGFLISTSAYRDFVDTNNLAGSILEIVSRVTPHEAASVELASARVHSLFEAARVPTAIASCITDAYTLLGEDEPAVAVRSSATAEDLPDLSFAGQHGTYLSIHGEAAVLDAIRGCWASLWTSRAISYRMQMAIDQRAVAMGVVVQVMVPSEVAGILFTANPATGDRSELVVNASFGLGEAVVGGHVTPDTYVLDRANLELKKTLIGAKEQMVLPTGDQGTTTQPVPETRRHDSSLAEKLLGELAALSVKVEQHFDGQPQDIEWAVADGTCWLLQSRPITNLPPPPLRDVSWVSPVEGAKWVRRQVVEHMPDPLSPLFEELYLQEGLKQAMVDMGTDLDMPFDIEALFFDHGALFATVNGYAYVLMYPNKRVLFRLWRHIPKMLYWYATVVPRFFRNVVPLWRDEHLPAYLATIEQWKVRDLASTSDEQLLSGVRALTIAEASYWFDVSMVVGFAKLTDGLLNRFLTSRAVGGHLTSGVFLRGFPSKTLQAQEDLESIATQIRDAESLRDLVLTTPAGDLLDALTRHPASHAVLEHIHSHLERYGHQIYTLDFVEPTQGEHPQAVLLSLKTLVNSTGYDTRARQLAMAAERDTRVTATLESLGPLRRRLFRMFLGWAQRYGPHREEALFYLGAAWPTLRRLAQELGERLVAVGTLVTPDDVFYLKSSELRDAFIARVEGVACPDLAQQAERRRELREARKVLHPPVTVPVESRFRIGPFDLTMWESQKRNAGDTATLNGFAVSPGQVTGPATVILSPADFVEMTPNTILVCPTTTPAWTPLFAEASGLVTDIGGILAHGSIVAREYGIPAVLGTGTGTKRIVTGQRIRVDGDTGTVTVLE